MVAAAAVVAKETTGSMNCVRKDPAAVRANTVREDLGILEPELGSSGCGDPEHTAGDPEVGDTNLCRREDMDGARIGIPTPVDDRGLRTAETDEAQIMRDDEILDIGAAAYED